MSYLILFVIYNRLDFQQTLSAYFYKRYLKWSRIWHEHKLADVLPMPVLFSPNVQMWLGFAGNFVLNSSKKNISRSNERIIAIKSLL